MKKEPKLKVQWVLSEPGKYRNRFLDVYRIVSKNPAIFTKVLGIVRESFQYMGIGYSRRLYSQYQRQPKLLTERYLQ